MDALSLPTGDQMVSGGGGGGGGRVICGISQVLPAGGQVVSGCLESHAGLAKFCLRVARWSRCASSHTRV